MSTQSYFSEGFLAKLGSDIKNGVTPDKAFPAEKIIRPFPDHGDPYLMDGFEHDIQRVMYNPYYNRYSGKTQVFGMFENDDITRRDIHVQRVDQIAKIIGKRLGLNCALIEAIAFAHDLGHTPFGHTGEKFLHHLYHENTGRNFNHNIQSVRILTDIFPNNISLQVLDGVAGHNGEEPLEKITPRPRTDYEEFRREIEECYTDPENRKARRFIASTLEGLVVRYADVIAYLISDRLDYQLIAGPNMFVVADRKVNSETMSMLESDIIETSYGRDYIGMSPKTIDFVRQEMAYNYRYIYESEEANGRLNFCEEIMKKMYNQFLNDVLHNNNDSLVFRHHIDFIERYQSEKKIVAKPYRETEANQIVVDYISSMTDRYFVDVYKHVFGLEFKGYFDD